MGAKARPLRGFVHKGAPAVFPGLAVEWLRRYAGRLASAPLWSETRSARIDQSLLKSPQTPSSCRLRLRLILERNPCTRLFQQETRAWDCVKHLNYIRACTLKNAEMSIEPRILNLGDSAVTIEYGHVVDAKLHRRVMGLNTAVSAALAQGTLSGVTETVPTIRSLTIYFDSPRVRRADILAQLEPLIEAAGEAQLSGRRWRLPVCYEDDCAPDIQAVSERTGLSRTRVAELHGSARYTVFMLGFMPGFGFLGGLPEDLAMPRLTSPRTRVPARSVAITGQLCAIYPAESPGGWRLIGRTPIEMFEAHQGDSPCLLAPGDTVQFTPVPRAEFDALRAEVKSGAFARERLIAADGAA